MTPEELCDKLLGGKRIAIMHDEFRQVMIDTIRAAYEVEREACAIIAEDYAEADNDYNPNERLFTDKYGVDSIVAAIRARSRVALNPTQKTPD